MKRCNLKLFSEKKQPILISFQELKSTKFDKGMSKAHIQTFNKSIPYQSFNDSYNNRKNIMSSINDQTDKTLKEKPVSKNITARNDRYPFAGDAVFSFPVITDSMKYKRQSVTLKDIKRRQAKLLKGQNQLIYEKLRSKYDLERKDKANQQPKIKTAFHRLPLSKSVSKNLGILPLTKTKTSKLKTTINFFKKSSSTVSLKSPENKVTTLHNEKESIKANHRLSRPNDNDNDHVNDRDHDHEPEPEKRYQSYCEQTKEKELLYIKKGNTPNDFQLNDENYKAKSSTFDKYVETNRKAALIRNTKKKEKHTVNSDSEFDTSNNDVLDDQSKQSSKHRNNDISGNGSKSTSNNNNMNNNNDNKSSKDQEIIKSSESFQRKQGKDCDNANDNTKEPELNEKKMLLSSSSFTLKNINMSNLIKTVIENNKKAAEASSKHLFSEIGKDFKNTHMHQSNCNFFYSNNSAKHSTPSLGIPESPFTLNAINIKLTSPLEWRQHEETWNHLQSMYSVSNSLEGCLIPPNDSDVLPSSYLALFPSMINHSEYAKAETLSLQKDFCLAFAINDRIRNPKVEMRKWKDAYKRVILRWHPDKLFGMLTRTNLKENETALKLQKKSTSIINNANTLYKKIMETLTKIQQSRRS